MPTLPAAYAHIRNVRARRASLQHLLRRSRRRFRPFLPYFALLTYCFLGTMLFYVMENNMERYVDHRAFALSKCMDSIPSAFFFTMAACTTIGFGVVYPCTTAGRALTVPFIACGVPQLLVVLTDIGARMCEFMVWTVRLWKRRHNVVMEGMLTDIGARMCEFMVWTVRLWKRRHNVVLEDEIDVPASLGLALTLTCFVWCALYFYACESHPVWESVYASCLTFLAGDYTAHNFDIAGPFYAVVLVGFAMLSTTIQIVQNNIDNLTKRIERDVERKVKEGKLEGFEAEELIDEIVEERTRKLGVYGSMLRTMTTKRAKEHIVEAAESTIHETVLTDEVDKLREDLAEAREWLTKEINRREGQKQKTVQVCPKDIDFYIKQPPTLEDEVKSVLNGLLRRVVWTSAAHKVSHVKQAVLEFQQVGSSLRQTNYECRLCSIKFDHLESLKMHNFVRHGRR